MQHRHFKLVFSANPFPLTEINALLEFGWKTLFPPKRGQKFKVQEKADDGWPTGSAPKSLVKRNLGLSVCQKDKSSCSEALTVDEDKDGQEHERDAELHLVKSGAFGPRVRSDIVQLLWLFTRCPLSCIYTCSDHVEVQPPPPTQVLRIYACFTFVHPRVAAAGRHGTVSSGTDHRATLRPAIQYARGQRREQILVILVFFCRSLCRRMWLCLPPPHLAAKEETDTVISRYSFWKTSSVYVATVHMMLWGSAIDGIVGFRPWGLILTFHVQYNTVTMQSSSAVFLFSHSHIHFSLVWCPFEVCECVFRRLSASAAAYWCHVA